MKPGYGGKKGKNKSKKAAKKAAQKARAGGDDANMQDAGVSSEEIDYTMHSDEGTARDKQRSKMEMKKALKVRVQALKQNRTKLTKLPGKQKHGAKQINHEIKALIKEQADVGSKGKKGTAKAAAGAEGGMEQ